MVLPCCRAATASGRGSYRSSGAIHCRCAVAAVEVAGAAGNGGATVVVVDDDVVQRLASRSKFEIIHHDM